MKAGGRAASARQGKLFLSLMMEAFCRNKMGSRGCYQREGGVDWQDRKQGLYRHSVWENDYQLRVQGEKKKDIWSYN